MAHLLALDISPNLQHKPVPKVYVDQGDIQETNMPSRMRSLFEHADYWAPNLEVQATSKFYLVTIKLPGLTRNEVNVMVDDGVLTFRGNRGTVFTRSISLPDDVEDSRIAVQYNTGVLTIHLPRMGKEPPPAFEFRRQ